jgi:hypothetical protein
VSYVQVPAEAIRAKLLAAGFERFSQPGAEEVYARKHDADVRYVVKVYSSIRQGSDRARGRGQDAIRVVAVFGDRGIYKSERVYRTGSVEAVLDRMMQRARDAYAFCSKHRRSS